MAKKFGDNLSHLIKAKGVTPREVSRACGLKYKTLMDQIVAHRCPRDPETLRKLATYFQCSIEFLLFGEEPKTLIENILEKTELHTGLYEISIRKVNTKNSAR